MVYTYNRSQSKKNILTFPMSFSVLHSNYLPDNTPKLLGLTRLVYGHSALSKTRQLMTLATLACKQYHPTRWCECFGVPTMSYQNYLVEKQGLHMNEICPCGIDPLTSIFYRLQIWVYCALHQVSQGIRFKIWCPEGLLHGDTLSWEYRVTRSLDT